MVVVEILDKRVVGGCYSLKLPGSIRVVKVFVRVRAQGNPE